MIGIGLMIGMKRIGITAIAGGASIIPVEWGSKAGADTTIAMRYGKAFRMPIIMGQGGTAAASTAVDARVVLAGIAAMMAAKNSESLSDVAAANRHGVLKLDPNAQLDHPIDGYLEKRNRAGAVMG